MPDEIDLNVLSGLPAQIEQLQGGGPQATASRYMAQITVDQIRATQAAKQSADKFAIVLVVLTGVLIVLTIVIAVLTAVLVSRGH